MLLTPDLTWAALLAVQTLHLLHHLVAKRHISFVEVLTSAVLLIPSPQGAVAALLLMILHLGLILVQLIGSVWIRKLSPGCGNERSFWATLG
ncbi:MAG TPA: hypothetical protein VGE22_10800 [Solimonas sp.]